MCDPVNGVCDNRTDINPCYKYGNTSDPGMLQWGVRVQEPRLVPYLDVLCYLEISIDGVISITFVNNFRRFYILEMVFIYLW